MKPSDQQIGGGHYKDLPIEPAEFCQRNRIPWCEANAIKYLVRHRDKNGIQDLRKAKHYIDLLIEWEYSNGNPDTSLATECERVLAACDDKGQEADSAKQVCEGVQKVGCSDCSTPLHTDFDRLSLLCPDCRARPGLPQSGLGQPVEADA